MVNDEKYINEVLDKLKKVSDEEIVEAIKKVDLEDDIKILEEMKEIYERQLNGFHKEICEERMKAIENLLKRHKELEEENKTYIAQLNGAFDRGFIPISVIQKYKEKFLEDSKNEEVFMTQSTQINASLISFCDELLEERNK